jgi:hypothetical protein
VVLTEQRNFRPYIPVVTALVEFWIFRLFLLIKGVSVPPIVIKFHDIVAVAFKAAKRKLLGLNN